MIAAHPVSERAAARFHATLASYFLLGIVLFSLGAWFHSVSFGRHWRDRDA